MNYEEIVKWLRSNQVETGSLLCLGCGYEHHCGIHGCAVMLAAADAMENLQTENAAIRRQIDSLTDAQAVMVKEFTEKLDELEQVKAERDAAVHDLHGECFACEHVDTDCPATNCRNGEKFKWRGPQKEEKPHEKTDN